MIITLGNKVIEGVFGSDHLCYFVPLGGKGEGGGGSTLLGRRVPESLRGPL